MMAGIGGAGLAVVAGMGVMAAVVFLYHFFTEPPRMQAAAERVARRLARTLDTIEAEHKHHMVEAMNGCPACLKQLALEEYQAWVKSESVYIKRESAQ